jgi:pantoate--beta-alanine ligase
MEIVRDIAGLRSAVAQARASGRRVGFVPTMGALHRGHLALIERARQDCPFVVVSIFVNPTQFGPNEDYARYPRDEAGDAEKCRAAGASLVFMPPVHVMYPPGTSTSVRVARLTDHLCGPARPGHFDGVALIVCKLFNLVQPDAAYFGEKDAQQLAVIRRMVADLDFPIQIVGCPTVREPDGLALSSRNEYLSEDERRRAPALYAALSAARERIRAGERSVAALLDGMRRTIDAASPTKIDYISIVDADALQPVEGELEPGRAVLIAMAVWFGRTRLIDNVAVVPAADPRAAIT